MSWLVAISIARILASQDAAPPELSDHAVLFIANHAACPSGDAGVNDAGVPDAGIADAGVTDAGTPTSCGTITMVVQPDVTNGLPGEQFAALLVTPALPTIELVDHGMSDLDAATAPLVEVEEHEVVDPSLPSQCGNPYAQGCGYQPRVSTLDGGHWDPPDVHAPPDDGGNVSLQTVGPYQILRAQPTTRSELAQWLDTYQFTYHSTDLDALEPYIARGYTIVAASVTAPTPHFRLKPLALTWAGTEIRVPLALAGTHDEGAGLTVYIAANDTTYTLPTSDVVYGGQPGTMSNAYVTRNELVIPQITSPDDDPIAKRTYTTLYYRPVDHEVVDVKVAPTVDCDQRDEEFLGCCGDCSARRGVRPDTIIIVLVVLIAIRRKRR